MTRNALRDKRLCVDSFDTFFLKSKLNLKSEIKYTPSAVNFFGKRFYSFKKHLKKVKKQKKLLKRYMRVLKYRNKARKLIFCRTSFKTSRIAVMPVPMQQRRYNFRKMYAYHYLLRQKSYKIKKLLKKTLL